MFMAAKYEEIHPPQIELFLETSGGAFSRRDIVELESRILAGRQFNLTFPTRYSLLAVNCN